MGFSAPRRIHNGYLLPLLVAVSVFLISQGISLPDFITPHDAKLSKLTEAKQACVVVKQQEKTPQTRVVKSAPCFALNHKLEPAYAPVPLANVYQRDSRSATSVLNPTFPARAPPA